MPEGEREASVFVDHFRDWLRYKMSGCAFAADFSRKAATKDRVAYWTLLGPLRRGDVAVLNAVIDDSASSSRFVIAIFPHVRMPDEIADTLQMLGQDARWFVERVDWRKHARGNCGLVGLTWQSPTGKRASVIGFAPLGSMPVTRRAPYTALALWPGPQVNEYRSEPSDVVGIVHGAHQMSKVAYDVAWSASKDKVAEMLSEPPEDRPHLRNVGFCLPRALADAACE